VASSRFPRRSVRRCVASGCGAFSPSQVQKCSASPSGGRSGVQPFPFGSGIEVPSGSVPKSGRGVLDDCGRFFHQRRALLDDAASPSVVGLSAFRRVFCVVRFGIWRGRGLSCLAGCLFRGGRVQRFSAFRGCFFGQFAQNHILPDSLKWKVAQSISSVCQAPVGMGGCCQVLRFKYIYARFASKMPFYNMSVIFNALRYGLRRKI